MYKININLNKSVYYMYVPVHVCLAVLDNGTVNI